MKMYMFKCFDSTATDCDVFLYFEFGATELNSTFETTPCYCRATAGSNSYEFDTAVAARLKRALEISLISPPSSPSPAFSTSPPFQQTSSLIVFSHAVRL